MSQAMSIKKPAAVVRQQVKIIRFGGWSVSVSPTARVAYTDYTARYHAKRGKAQSHNVYTQQLSTHDL